MKFTDYVALAPWVFLLVAILRVRKFRRLTVKGGPVSAEIEGYSTE